MAPRKKKASTTPKKLAASKAKLASVEKPSVAREPTRQSARIGRKTHVITYLKNGLLSMETTPKYLVEVVRRNSTESPLLRLPGELRDKIWKYAVGGHRVLVGEDEDETMVDLETGKHFSVWRGNAVERNLSWLGGYDQVPSAFHLPEVCRRLYAETATLSYALNTFVFENIVYDSKWAEVLLPSQRDAIADIELDEWTLLEHVWNFQSDDLQPKLSTQFPGLKRIHLHEETIQYMSTRSARLERIRSGETKKGWEDWLRKKVKEREGQNIQVVLDKDDLSLAAETKAQGADRTIAWASEDSDDDSEDSDWAE